MPSYPRIAELGLVVVGTFMITYQPQSDFVWSSTSMGIFQTGVTTALISNAACCLRSVTSAQIMREYAHYTPIYLYSELSMWALGLLAPYAMVGYLLASPNHSPSASSNGAMIAAAGLTHYLYYVASYIVLKHLSVLRHSVLNVAKRTTSVLAGLLLLGEEASTLGYVAKCVHQVILYL
jgi:drug/metabolite transporter (DMT)-like permease